MFTNIINNIVSAMLQLLYLPKYAPSLPRYEWFHSIIEQFVSAFSLNFTHSLGFIALYYEYHVQFAEVFHKGHLGLSIFWYNNIV